MFTSATTSPSPSRLSQRARQEFARYIGGGQIQIEEGPMPVCPAGGFLMETRASGLCSGELMDWYMDRKIPHVLGHELAGIVIESDTELFPIGAKVAPHHHAPCLECDFCRKGQFVHCPTWRSTKLDPGGMARYVAVQAELLADTHRVDALDFRDAALMEPLACVMKSRRRARWTPADRTAVVGLGVMGLLHAITCPGAVGFDLNPEREAWATSLGIATSPEGLFDVIFVCPGTSVALARAMELAAPGARILMFSPLAPDDFGSIDLNGIYFRDIELISSYSCGPEDTAEALAEFLVPGLVRSEQVVSDFIALADLPEAYQKMKQGKLLKPMVVFS